MSRYEWDARKAAANFRRHGVAFEEADDVALSPLAEEEIDLDHADLELRVKIIGWSPRGRLLVVIVSLKGPRPRLISARRATKRERDAYTT